MGSGEHAPRMEFAAGDLADRNQLAAGKRHGSGSATGASRPRRMIGLPIRSRCAWSSVCEAAAGQRAPRPYRQECIECGKPFIAVFDGLERHELRKRHHQSSANGATKVRRSEGDMAIAAEIATEVTRQRAHIGALAAFDSKCALSPSQFSSVRR